MMRDVRGAQPAKPWLVAATNLVAAVLLGYNLVFFWSRILTLPSSPNDFSQYYIAARRILIDAAIYQGLVGYAVENSVPLPFNDSFPYPPFVAILNLPIAVLPYIWAWRIWLLFSLSCLLLSVFLIHRSLRFGSFGRYVLPVMAVVLSYPPVRSHFDGGQTQLFLLLLLVAAWIGLRRNRGVLAGVLIGLASAAKLFPALLILLLVARRWWRVVSASIIAFAMVSIASFALLGVQQLGEYFTIALPSLRSGLLSPLSISVRGVVGFLMNATSTGFVAPAILLWHVMAILVISGSLFALSFPAILSWSPGKGSLDLEFSLFCVAMVLFSPISWEHYLVLIFLPIACYFVEICARLPQRPGFLRAFLFFFTLTWMRHFVGVFDDLPNLVALELWLTPFYGLLGFYGLNIWLLWDRHRHLSG